MVDTINHDSVFESPGCVRSRLAELAARYRYPCLVLYLGPNVDPSVFDTVAEAQSLGFRTLFAIASETGVVAGRGGCVDDLADSIELLEPPGNPTPELAMLAAGCVLNEILTARSINAAHYEHLATTQLVGFYSLAHSRRSEPQIDYEDALMSITAAPPPLRSFGGQRLKLVGAGALGNWIGLSPHSTNSGGVIRAVPTPT